MAGRWLSLIDWGGRGVTPLRAGLRYAAAWLRRSEVLSWKGGTVSGRVGGMSMDTELQKHYALLLGIGSPWEVKTVELKLPEKKVEIELGWQWGQSAKCPECGRACSIHDSAPERTWRHLDTMQFATLIRARTPRSDCPEHGVKTMQVPWAEPQGRFTLLFERFAVDVLTASASVSQACELLGIGWETAHGIMCRAVERGLERRQLEALPHLGMDEKSFGRGQSYITLLTDLEQARVLEVVEDRTAEAAQQLWQTLSPEQKQTVEAVAVDMWEPFIRTIEKEVPDADIVHDKYHVSSYLGKAVDQVRRQEHKELMAQGDETLKGSRQLWLYNPSPEQRSEFGALKDLHLKVAVPGRPRNCSPNSGTIRRRAGRGGSSGWVQLGQPQPTQAAGRGGTNAQTPLGQFVDILEASHHQRSDRRIELQNPEHQSRRPRFPQLSELPHSHPVLLRKARSLPIMNLEESER